MSNSSGIVAEVPWIVTPFRGDKFEAHWLPVAEAALDYGATGWALLRSKEGGLDFHPACLHAVEAGFRALPVLGLRSARPRGDPGLVPLPIVPEFHSLAGMGSLAPQRYSVIVVSSLL